ncbi:MAG: Sapep family Mn(2+)-dependent dipeptidase, partial [Clostridia bacterium]|nr:Sapep family Mn(2+)-dependent dipeptidase [Clostridia bacterium]
MTYKEYFEANRDNIIRDIKRLIDIRSVQSAPVPGAPYGEGVRRVQLEASEMCREAGLEVVDCEGRIGYAHLGPKDRFIGIIAHLDVVPEGNGWDFDPYCMIEKDGFLIGRGTGDNKAPFVISLYAIKYLMQEQIPLRYGIRLFMGLDEETGMSDIEYYLENYPAPVFTYTPDSAFPVGHGEKGILSCDFVSPEIPEGVILDLNGGVASNVVPDRAYAVVKACKCCLEKVLADHPAITLEDNGETVKVCAQGKSAHAGSPRGSVNAIAELVNFLLAAGVCSDAEKAALSFISSAAGNYEGAQFDINAADGLFDPNTIVVGMVHMANNRFTFNVNSRYGTAIAPDEIEKRLAATAEANSYTIENMSNSGPFYMDPDYPAVKLLCGIYNELTGSDGKPYVMAGGTYARHIPNAVSYGMAGIPVPPSDGPALTWAPGGAHAKNE